MFFKRLTKTKSAPAATPFDSKKKDDESAQRASSTVGEVASQLKPLAPSELHRAVDRQGLGFDTTADLEPANGLAGQDRALAAIEFGLSMRARDFNIFIVGTPSAGRSAAVRAHLAKIAAASQTPPDWVYVHNFDDPRRPRALSLPPGRAKELAHGMERAMRELAGALPAAFASEDYRARRRAIEEAFRAGHETALEMLEGRAAEQNIAVLRTPLGFAMAPMHDGKVVRREVFSQLPEAMRVDVERRISAFEAELEAILADRPNADKRRRRQTAELDGEVLRHVLDEALAELSQAFADVPEVVAFLAGVETDLMHGASQFALPDSERIAIAAQIEPAQDSRLRRYLVNVLVSRPDEKAGAPVCETPVPTLGGLVGSLEHSACGGGCVADFLSIRPGVLHNANGGALVVDARRLIADPEAWNGLKRALEAGEISIPRPPASASGAATPMDTLEPEPTPLAIKVVLMLDPETLERLERSDPEFPQLFKVQADFDESIARSTENDRIYARLVASIVQAHGLKPIDSGGVARLMEEAQRVSEDRDKLALETGRIADIVREADYWSDADSRKVTTAADVARALKEWARRRDRMREQVQETIERGLVQIDTGGRKVGQINALSLVQKGSLAFGRPARITARVHLGQGGVIDIEREVALGGPLHAKGVMILSGYLAGRFAQEVPLALAATLVFEQSYDTVEGDSASASELFALMSALADAPLRQDMAVTGSLNQWGEIQAVGGVNEKIEAFFDLCVARGLTGSQGVLIPEANRHSLMLREDVVTATREGRFAVYAIRTVDEGIALLTGLDAGERGADGRFAPETVNGRIDARLRSFAERARAFAAGGAPGSAAKEAV